MTLHRSMINLSIRNATSAFRSLTQASARPQRKIPAQWQCGCPSQQLRSFSVSLPRPVTLQQCLRGARKPHRPSVNRVPALEGRPFVKGVCSKVSVRVPSTFDQSQTGELTGSCSDLHNKAQEAQLGRAQSRTSQALQWKNRHSLYSR